MCLYGDWLSVRDVGYEYDWNIGGAGKWSVGSIRGVGELLIPVLFTR